MIWYGNGTREFCTTVTTCLHNYLLKYLGLSKSQNNTLHSCCSNCDGMQSVPHKKFTPNPSDPKLNPVMKVSEEQHKIMSRLLKNYRLKHRIYNFVGRTDSGQVSSRLLKTYFLCSHMG